MSSRRTPPGELVCIGLLFALLLWAPLPFGSTPDEYQLPLVAGALSICAVSAAVVALGRGRIRLTPAHRVWSGGAVVFLLVVAVQLVDLPDGMLGVISPQSLRIWRNAGQVAAIVLGAPPPAMHPISVDPPATALHLFRLLAYFGVFTAAALLLRRHGQRVALAVTLSLGALFQTGYALREAVLGRFTIWGWKNTLIFNRMTGTFVNPNHFADYAAIVAPLGFFLFAASWHDASAATARLRYRLLRVLERRLVPAVFGAIVVGSCLVSILLSKSRGSVMALFAGSAIGMAAVGGRRLARVALFLAAASAVVVSLVLFLGRERTALERGTPGGSDVLSLGGRRTGLETAVAIWRRFPVVGSGLGTFERLAPMSQPGAFEQIYNHAHDDYAEIAATTGTVGLLAFLVPLVVGLSLFARASFATGESWRRRAFHAAALASMATALLHALVDFPFFIPANAVTLAAIAGAAVATRSESASIRGSALEDSQA
jgi:O-antigen ligase